MEVKKGICTNFLGCAKAEDAVIQEIPLGMEFVCSEPGCERPLTEKDDRPPSSIRRYILITSTALVAISAIWFWPSGQGSISEPPGRVISGDTTALPPSIDESESPFQLAFNRISAKLSQIADPALPRSEYATLREETLALFSSADAFVVEVGKSTGEATERKSIWDFLSEQRLIQQYEITVENVRVGNDGLISEVSITKTSR